MLNPNISHMRKEERFMLTGSVDLSKDFQRVAFGEMHDISASGIGFKSHAPLKLGAQYHISIRGFGNYRCEIVHRAGFSRYGAKLIMSDKSKRLLVEKIKAAIEA